MLCFFACFVGLARRGTALAAFLLLAGSSTYGQHAPYSLSADSTSTRFLRLLQRQVSPGDTLALDTLRIQAAVHHVDSLVQVAQVAAARRQQQQRSADSLRFLAYIQGLERLLLSNGALPARNPEFALESTGTKATLLRPADQLKLSIPAQYKDLFQELSRNSATINANIRTDRLRVSYVYQSKHALNSVHIVANKKVMTSKQSSPGDDSGVVAVLDAVASTQEQRRREESFRPRNAAALQSLEVLYRQFYRLGRKPRFTKEEYRDFEKKTYLTEEARYTFRTQCIKQLAADLAKL